MVHAKRSNIRKAKGKCLPNLTEEQASGTDLGTADIEAANDTATSDPFRPAADAAAINTPDSGPKIDLLNAIRTGQVMQCNSTQSRSKVS